MIAINIHNSDIRDLFVTIFDLNTSPDDPPPSVANQRLNEGLFFSLGVQEDGGGRGNIRWVVQDANDASVTAERTTEVSSNSQVDVTTQFG